MSLFDKINKGSYTLQPTVNDDLTTNKGWVSNTGSWTYNASGDYIDFATITRSQTAQQIYIDVQDGDYLGSGNNLSDTKWVARFKVRTGTQSSSSGNVLLYFGFSNNLGDSGTTQQSATMKMNFNGQANENNMTLSVSRANFETTSPPARVNSNVYANPTLPYSTDLYMEMTRNGDVFTLKAYSDEYVTQASSTSVASVTVTGISSLRYIKAFNDSEQNQSYTSSGARLYDMKIYNGTTTLSNVFPQRVVENFSGSAVDTNRWTNTGFGAGAGNTTFTMNNEVDGGALMLVSSGTSGEGIANFNNIRQFSPTGSVFICVTKSNDVASGQNSRVGLKHGTDVTFNGGQLAGTENGYNVTSISSFCADASGFNRTNTSLSRDSLWHTFKGQLTASDYKLTVDGLMETTDTTNLPTVRLQPFLYKAFNSGYTSSSSTRYYEAYNT